MITIREATGKDVAAIHEIFLATYGTDYTDPRYYDDALLTRLVYSDASLLLVAEDRIGNRLISRRLTSPRSRQRPYGQLQKQGHPSPSGWKHAQVLLKHHVNSFRETDLKDILDRLT